MTYSYKFKRKTTSPWQPYFNKLSDKLSNLDTPTLITATTIVAYIFVVFVGVYVLLRRTGILPPNAFRKLLWRVFVYSIPPSLVLALERRDSSNKNSDDPFEDENTYAATRTFGAKSQAMKSIFGLRGASLAGGSRTGRSGPGSPVSITARGPPGLFNRNNECYQNSVIQGLASLHGFRDFIERQPTQNSTGSGATLVVALQAITTGLNSSDNYGRGLWTPWALKSMSSWQQQDAQEYYSRVIDEVEKDIKKLLKHSTASDTSALLAGLALDEEIFSNAITIPSSRQGPDKDFSLRRNPLEGLQAQRVGCLRCGYVEGLSLIPFNCITLSLGRENHYDLEGLLSSYTNLETIPGVECAKCTLLSQEKILKRLIELRSQDKAPSVELDDTKSRLQAAQAALKDEDFSESTLTKKCRISGKARVLTDKTKQSVIARAPQSLVLHINRSVFDERTGVQLKNYSQVQFPKFLDLNQWCLGQSQSQSSDEIETWDIDPSVSMLGETNEKSVQEEKASNPEARLPKSMYQLRALITHYGTHGDGHYVAWRQDSRDTQGKIDTSTWWRLSDDDVVRFDEDTVLKQGGVFMLFYERVAVNESSILLNHEEPVQESQEATIIEPEPESPSNFLSSEIQAALDAKLERYTATKDNTVTAMLNSKTREPVSSQMTPKMRTASEARPMILESVGGLAIV